MLRLMSQCQFGKVIAALILLNLVTIVTASVSTYSQAACFTSQTTKKPASVPTSSYALTLTFTKKKTTTVTPTTTFTPSTVTTTTVSTATTTTTVTTQSTTTIAASAGFVPLASQLAAQGHATTKKKKRSGGSVIVRNAAPAANALEPRATSTGCMVQNHNGKTTATPVLYPGSVKCYKLAEVVTFSTITATASTTITITAAQQTTTATSVTTTTSTVTSEQPQATFYAACGNDNLVSSVDGFGIDTISDFSNGLSFVAANSAYDCCVACVLNSNCAGTIFDTRGLGCIVANGPGTCSASNMPGSIATSGDQPPTIFIASNSNCGSLQYTG